MSNTKAVQKRRTIQPLPLGQKGWNALMRGKLPQAQGDSRRRLWLILSKSDGILGEIEADDHREARSLADECWPNRGDESRVWNRVALEEIRKSRERQFQRNRWRVAYHEAGHAVIALHLGIRVVRITMGVTMYSCGFEIDFDAISFGGCEYDQSSMMRNMDLREVDKRVARFLIAGPMAEYRFRGNRDWMVPNRRRLSRSDARNVRVTAWVPALQYCDCMIRQAKGEEVSKRHERCIRFYIKQAAQETGEMLDAHWYEVASVASELERRRELYREDLDRLISGVPSIGPLGPLY